MHNKTLLLLLLALSLLMPRGMQAAGDAYAAEGDDEQVLTVCWGMQIALSDIFILENLSFNDECGTPHFMAVRFAYDENNAPYVLDTICRDRAGEEQFMGWLNNFMIRGNNAGKYVLQFYARCENAPDFQSIGVIHYRVIPEFRPGVITAGRDTMYMQKGKIRVNVASITPASGGDGNIHYRWKRGIQDLYAADENLENYPITDEDLTFPALLKLHRRAYDGSGCGNALAEGTYAIVVFDEFKPGKIDTIDNPEFCSVEVAQAYTITASAAEGGTERYHYQWFMEHDGVETPIAGATNKDLPLSMVSLEYGQHYTFSRKVEDDTRFTTPTPAANPQSIYISSGDEVRTREWVVCVPSFPYTVSWFDTKGNEFTHTIESTPNDEWKVLDEHHPSGCTMDTTLLIRVRLDGCVRAKFDRILFVDTTRYVATQWYKNGEKLTGETRNYYDEGGNELKGLYEVDMTGKDGRTYRSCAIQMPQATAVNELLCSEPAVFPVPAEAGQPVTVVNNGGTIAIYSCTGEPVMQTASTEQQISIDAPQIRGLYYVQIIGKDGRRRTEKLLVK